MVRTIAAACPAAWLWLPATQADDDAPWTSGLELSAFDVKEGDGLWRPEAERVKIW